MSDFEASALRFRPQHFAQLAGQEFVVRTLTAEIVEGRISHAYLFSGPRGVGKTSAARLLAQAINYPQLLTQDTSKDGVGDADGLDEQWHSIRRGSSIDVIEIDGASNTSVQDVRRIREEVQFAPQQLRYKIYIIDEVHMLSGSAFNALLKTIEEPPPYVVFIFATTEVHKVPATVRSRCQQFSFRQIPLDVIVQQLQMATKRLDISGITDEVLFWIATEASGSMRDAYTLFDQIVALESDGVITLEQVFAIFGKSSHDSIVSIATHLAQREVKLAIEQLHQILNSGLSQERFLSDLCECYRIVLLCLHNIKDKNILRVENTDLYAQLSASYRPVDVIAILDECMGLYRNLRSAQDGARELELCLAKIAYICDRLTVEELMKQLHKVAGQIDAAPESPTAPTDTQGARATHGADSSAADGVQAADTSANGAQTADTSANGVQVTHGADNNADGVQATHAADTSANGAQATHAAHGAGTSTADGTQAADTSAADGAQAADTSADGAQMTQAADNNADGVQATHGAGTSTADGAQMTHAADNNAADGAQVTHGADTSADEVQAAHGADTSAADGAQAAHGAEEQAAAPPPQATARSRLDAAILSQVCAVIEKEQASIASALSAAACFCIGDNVEIQVQSRFECDSLEECRPLLEETFRSILQQHVAITIKVHQAEALSEKDKIMIAKVQKYFHGEVAQAI